MGPAPIASGEDQETSFTVADGVRRNMRWVHRRVIESRRVFALARSAARTPVRLVELWGRSRYQGQELWDRGEQGGKGQVVVAPAMVMPSQPTLARVARRSPRSDNSSRGVSKNRMATVASCQPPPTFDETRGRR